MGGEGGGIVAGVSEEEGSSRNDTIAAAASPESAPPQSSISEEEGKGGGGGADDEDVTSTQDKPMDVEIPQNLEAASEEDRIVVDGLVSLLAGDRAEREIDRLLQQDDDTTTTDLPGVGDGGEGGSTTSSTTNNNNNDPQPVTLSAAGIHALRKRFRDLQLLNQRQNDLIRSQGSEIEALHKALEVEKETNGVRQAYLQVMERVEGRRRRRLAREAGIVVNSDEHEREDEVEALQDEVARLERLARDLSAYGDATESQLSDVKRILVDHAEELNHILPIRWFGHASRNEVREALRERQGLLKKEFLNAACQAAEEAICDEDLDPFERNAEGTVVGVNRRLPLLQRLGLEYGKGMIELVVAKKREISRFSSPSGPQRPLAVMWEDGRELPVAEAVRRVLNLLLVVSKNNATNARPSGHHTLAAVGPPSSSSYHHRLGPAGSSSSSSGGFMTGPAAFPSPISTTTTTATTATGGQAGGTGSGNSSLAGGGGGGGGGASSSYTGSLIGLPPPPASSAPEQPLLIINPDMASKFQHWLRENTTIKTAVIQTAGASIDGFLVKVAANALMNASDDPENDESLSLPQMGNYEDLKEFIEANVAQCEREASNASKTSQKLWSYFLVYLGYADDVNNSPSHQLSSSGHEEYEQRRGNLCSTAGSGAISINPHDNCNSRSSSQQHQQRPGGGVSTSSTSRTGGGGGGGGGRQTSILDSMTRQGFMEWMTGNTRANTNSQAGLLSAVNCCLRSLVLKHIPAQVNDEMSPRELRIFIRIHQSEVEQTLEKSTSCTLKTGWRYFYRFLQSFMVEEGEDLQQKATGYLAVAPSSSSSSSSYPSRPLPSSTTAPYNMYQQPQHQQQLGDSDLMVVDKMDEDEEEGGGGSRVGQATNPSIGSGSSGINILRSRLPAILDIATQESFVNWLRQHTQLRQDASIRNALRAVNKFLRMATIRQRGGKLEEGAGGDEEHLAALGQGEEDLILDRQGAEDVVAREEELTGTQPPLITGSTPGYAKTAWKYFAQYLLACRDEDVYGRGGSSLTTGLVVGERYLDDGGIPPSWRAAAAALHTSSSSSSSNLDSEGVTKRKRASSSVTVGATSPPPSEVAVGNPAAAGASSTVDYARPAKTSKTSSSGNNNHTLPRHAPLDPETLQAFDEWLEVNSTACGSADSRAYFVEAVCQILSEVMKKRGGGGGKALQMEELHAFVERHQRALEGAVMAATPHLFSVKPAYECLLQFLEDDSGTGEVAEERKSVSSGSSGSGTNGNSKTSLPLKKRSPSSGSAAAIIPTKVTRQSIQQQQQQQVEEERKEVVEEREEQEEEEEYRRRRKGSGGKAVIASETSSPYPSRSRSTNTASTAMPSSSTRKASTTTTTTSTAGATATTGSFPPSSSSSTATTAATIPAAIERSSSISSSTTGGGSSKVPRVLVGTVRRGLLAWLRAQGQSGKSLETFCSGVNRLLLCLLKELRAVDPAALESSSYRELDFKDIEGLVAECSAKGGLESVVPLQHQGSGSSNSDTDEEDLSAAWNILAAYVASIEEETLLYHSESPSSASTRSPPSSPKVVDVGGGVTAASNASKQTTSQPTSPERDAHRMNDNPTPSTPDTINANTTSLLQEFESWCQAQSEEARRKKHVSTSSPGARRHAAEVICRSLGFSSSTNVSNNRVLEVQDLVQRLERVGQASLLERDAGELKRLFVDFLLLQAEQPVSLQDPAAAGGGVVNLSEEGEQSRK